MNNDKEKNINLLLSRFKSETGFKTPENYFDKIADNIYAKISEDTFSKSLDFDIPEDYFETVENKILGKTSETNNKGKVISLKRFTRAIPYAVAACLVLFLGIQLFNNSTQNLEENLLASDIEEWLTDSLDFEESSELAFAFESSVDFNENEIVFQDDLIEDYFGNVSDIDLLNELE